MLNIVFKHTAGRPTAHGVPIWPYEDCNKRFAIKMSACQGDAQS